MKLRKRRTTKMNEDGKMPTRTRRGQGEKKHVTVSTKKRETSAKEKVC